MDLGTRLGRAYVAMLPRAIVITGIVLFVVAVLEVIPELIPQWWSPAAIMTVAIGVFLIRREKRWDRILGQYQPPPTERYPIHPIDLASDDYREVPK